MRPMLTLIALMLMLSVSAFAQVTTVPNSMNFQGRLARPDGTPVPNGTHSVRFSLWTAATGGTEKWSQVQNVTVRNGTFAALLSGFPAGTFHTNLFLEVKIGTAAPLTPRQPLVSVAYAMKADSVKDSSITSSSIVNGTITAADLASGALNTLSWRLNGNANPAAGSFLGTTTNHPLDLRVNNRRALRYSYAQDTSSPGFEYRSINTLGGADINSIASGVVGGTVVGGGSDSFTGTDSPNRVSDNFGTVVGGSLNQAGGFSFVGGGYNNKATEFYSTIVGGTYNTASNNQTFIGGGISNTASGFGAVVPGGQQNEARGAVSFAAGNNAHALHDGSFVWADNSQLNTPFASTSANQFLVRAAGGAFIHGPTFVRSLLAVDNGLIIDNANANGGNLVYGLRFGANSGEGIFSKRTAGGNQWGLDFATAFSLRMSITSGGNVGIGTSAPVGTLHVKGFQGAFNLEGTSDHVYMQFFPRGVNNGRKAYIGFASAGTHDLTIANEDGGAVRVIGTFINNSDARWKTNVSPLNNALESILRLHGVSYDWRTDIPGQHFTQQRQIGFLAQEVEKVLPDLVYTDEKGYKSVAYINVVPVLVEAVKTQQKQIEELKAKNARIGNIEAENVELKARLDALAAAVAELKAERK